MNGNTRPSQLTEANARARGWDTEFSEIDTVLAHRFDLTESAPIFDRNSIPLTEYSRHRHLGKPGAPVACLKDRSIERPDNSATRPPCKKALAHRSSLSSGTAIIHSPLRGFGRASHLDVMSAVAESLATALDNRAAGRIGAWRCRHMKWSARTPGNIASRFPGSLSAALTLT